MTQNNSISREAAIAQLAQRDLQSLPPAQRAEMLAAMQQENWEQQPGWLDLSPRVRRELQRPQTAIVEPEHTRYDAALLMALSDRHLRSNKQSLPVQLERAEFQSEPVPVEFDAPCACPCCGLATLPDLGNYSICRVCWWEDDGTDNAEPQYSDGSNKVSLIRARINVLQTGLFDPRRSDLRSQQKPPEKYARARRFVLVEDGAAVQEPATGWKGRLVDEVIDD